jgi:outer membrane protein OmpA-like peptidoglycan-associated protein
MSPAGRRYLSTSSGTLFLSSQIVKSKNSFRFDQFEIPCNIFGFSYIYPMKPAAIVTYISLHFTLSCFSTAYSQATLTSTIAGHVSDTKKPAKKMYAFVARILVNDKVFKEVPCDSTGFFSTTIPDSLRRKYKTTVSVLQDGKKLKDLFPRPANTPYYYLRPDQYFASGDLRVLSNEGEARLFICDFSVNKAIICYSSPCIGFKKNKTDFLPCSGFDPDTTVMSLAYILNHEPLVVIEINGHSWDENRGKSLSLKRAEFLKEKLVAFGIDSARIKTKGKGNSQPIVTKTVIRKTDRKKEKEDLKKYNRRVEILVLSWDYDPLQKKIISKPSTGHLAEEDDE